MTSTNVAERVFFRRMVSYLEIRTKKPLCGRDLVITSDPDTLGIIDCHVSSMGAVTQPRWG